MHTLAAHSLDDDNDDNATHSVTSRLNSWTQQPDVKVDNIAE